MYCENFSHTIYSPNKTQSFRVKINCYHITITNMQGEEIYSRLPQNDNWLDAGHQRIAKSLSEMEKALTEAIQAEKGQ